MSDDTDWTLPQRRPITEADIDRAIAAEAAATGRHAQPFQIGEAVRAKRGSDTILYVCGIEYKVGLGFLCILSPVWPPDPANWGTQPTHGWLADGFELVAQANETGDHIDER